MDMHIKNMTDVFDFNEYTLLKGQATIGQYFHDLGRHLYAKHNFPDLLESEVEEKLRVLSHSAFMRELGIPDQTSITTKCGGCGGGKVL